MTLLDSDALKEFVRNSGYSQNCFEISFDQLLVPDFRIYEAAEAFPEFSEKAVYMLLQSDKLVFTNIDFNNDPPTIECRNTTTDQLYKIDNFWAFPCPISKEALYMEIISDTLIDTGIKEKYKQYYPQFVQNLKFDIYHLIALSNKNSVTKSQFDLLYIGRSKGFFNRTKDRHEKVNKIRRDIASGALPNKELFVWILKPKPEFHQRYSFDLCNFAFSDSCWNKEGPFSIDIEDKNLLGITEAMLVNYFKPQYNNHYVNGIRDIEDLKALRKAGVKKVLVNLNLFLQPTKDLLVVGTETENTNNNKHITLEMSLGKMLKEGSVEISSLVMPDELYPIFIGE